MARRERSEQRDKTESAAGHRTKVRLARVECERVVLDVLWAKMRYVVRLPGNRPVVREHLAEVSPKSVPSMISGGTTCCSVVPPVLCSRCCCAPWLCLAGHPKRRRSVWTKR